MEEILIFIFDILHTAITIAAFAYMIYFIISLMRIIISQRGMAKNLKILENKVLNDMSDDVKNDDENIK